MNAAPRVIVHEDARLLARAVAARLITRIVDVQAERETASVVLTGGTIGIALLAEVAAASARDAVDWARLDVWWGDERFLPEGDPERNETQARQALLDLVPLDPSRVHPMPASDGPDGDDVEAAAARHAAELREAARPETARSDELVEAPSFDVLLLGVGPDAHIASLFPGLPGVLEDKLTVVGVHDSPKPPPIRVSLTVPVIQAAREVWVIAAGEGKAEAVALGLSDASPSTAPVATARGRETTLYLLDRDAASHLP
ncbi:6-phosphogluconolactonase [Actinocorallia sp. A-T 12471]|uniref:6-phosphogluconolactonase n=1 Tax=Actinocorallia sp. A-T 12471 TaxID=3089813 RepID=UPI0029D23597|nr:6-phosphogluconolactonase [Actinocorallia sp. A-T 12471]MDX6740566.1 6-phosphogluconolactonase [Actinocorallia sp. A-T 12471]